MLANKIDELDTYIKENKPAFIGIAEVKPKHIDICQMYLHTTLMSILYSTKISTIMWEEVTAVNFPQNMDT